jgi:hypothetical protein
VTAKDRAGNAAQKVINYNVVYDNVGVSSTSSTVKFTPGKVIPFKFKLFDANSVAITTATARVYVDGAAGKCSGTTSNIMKFSTSKKMYVCNLVTKDLAVGTHGVEIRIDQDRSVHSYTITTRHMHTNQGTCSIYNTSGQRTSWHCS